MVERRTCFDLNEGMDMSNMTNKEQAINDANRADKEIIEALELGKSFRVEAGAGSGKTYSLNKCIDWIQAHKWAQFKKRHQQVACLTYTNVAVEVIKNRLKANSFIIPSTIHTFAWNAIKQYQNFLKEYIRQDESIRPKEGDIEDARNIGYELGGRYIRDKTLYIAHSDVINLFVIMLDQPKFRLVFASKYPLILIDEYQDSFKILIAKFIEHFLSKDSGPQFGFFGDAWQTIYQINKPCGSIEHENLVEIRKSSNFRSAPKIVDALNKIRPELPQVSAIDGIEGEVIVVQCNDYTGARRNDKNFKDELPISEIDNRLTAIENIFNINAHSSKTLMITHRMLAERQGYDSIYGVLGDNFRDNDEKILSFFTQKIEPIFEALNTSNSELLFQALGIKYYPINKKTDKLLWNKFREKLTIAREKKAIDVLKEVYAFSLIPTVEIDKIYTIYSDAPSTPHYKGTIKEYLDIEYAQFRSAISFHQPDSTYSTEHGVKGEEYDNVIFVIGKGWNLYQFEKYAPMMINGILESTKEDSYIRNRNLFYVCCSRPRNKLLIFVTTTVEREFEDFLKNLVGSDNYYVYDEFINKNTLNID